MQKLKKQFPNIKYIIAGEGDEKARLQQLVKKYDLYKHVLFTGNVNEQQKKTIV